MKDDRNPTTLATLPDEALIDAVQRQTLRCFCDGADAASGLALDRRMPAGDTAFGSCASARRIAAAVCQVPRRR